MSSMWADTLLAAESAGAMIAAEMQHTGVPWREELHERILADYLGPRPPLGHRPAKLEALTAELRLPKETAKVQAA